jgi:hypothetical protein
MSHEDPKWEAYKKECEKLGCTEFDFYELDGVECACSIYPDRIRHTELKIHSNGVTELQKANNSERVL